MCTAASSLDAGIAAWSAQWRNGTAAQRRTVPSRSDCGMLTARLSHTQFAIPFAISQQVDAAPFTHCIARRHRHFALGVADVLTVSAIADALLLLVNHHSLRT